MSNRLTFSLASLILIFAFVFVAMPVMAADDGPTPTITEYSGLDDPNTAAGPANAVHVQERTDFRLLVTFDALVTGAITDSNLTVTTAEAIGKATTTETTTGIGSVVAITEGADANKSYMVPVNLDTLDADYSQGYVSFILNADVVAGNQAGHSTDTIQNQKSDPFVLTTDGTSANGTLPKHTDWTITPSLDAATYKTADDIDGKNFKAGADPAGFTVNFRLNPRSSTQTQPTLTAGQIRIKDSKDMDVTTTGANSVSVTVGSLVGVVYPVALEFTGEVPHPITFGVNPNWAAGTTLQVPAAGDPDPDSVDPTVDIALVGIDETAETFEIKFTFAQADVTGMANKVAAALPTMLEPANIDITKQDLTDPTADPIPMIPSSAYVQAADIIGPISGGTVWLATVNYRLDALPLYVALKDINVSETTIAGMAPGMDDPSALRVPAGPVITPGAPAAPTLDMATPGDMEVALTWTAATTGDAATSFAYRVDGGTAMAITGSDGTTTMHTVTGLTNGTEYDFEVRGVNAVGGGAWSNLMSATPSATPIITPGAPAAPTLDMATPGDMEVALTWTAATTGDAATSFAYRVDGGTAMAITGSDGTTTMHTVTGLTNGTEYDFEVRGVNAVGGGAWSNLMSATPMATPDTTAPTVMIEVLSKDSNGKHMVGADDNVEFKLTFSEPLAKGPSTISRLQILDIDIRDHTGAAITETDGVMLSAATAESDGEYYTLTVPAPDPIMPLPVNNREPEREVLIEVGTTGVADVAANHLAGTEESRMAKFDTIPPTVVITPGYFNSSGMFVAASSGEPMAKLVFEFDFSEPLTPGFSTSNIEGSPTGANFRLLRDSDPQPVMGKDDAFTVIATIRDINAPTTVQIERLEVSDAAKNRLQIDVSATYTPTTQAPVATITARSPFYCGVTGNAVTVTISDNEAIASGETIAESEITVSAGWKIRTNSFRASTGARSATATFNVIRNDVETATDRSWLGIQEVTITVAGSAVKDNTNQVNAAKAMSYTAGPVITIQPGQYVVVIRDNVYTYRYSHLNAVRTLYLGDYNVRADNPDVQGWDCMPDLGLIFDRTVDASPGIGGGGLMVLQSRDHDTTKPIAKGTVGISEIMWSEDRGIPFGSSSNLEHAREQWIELHNTNSFAVKVTLFDLIRNEAYNTNDASRAGLIDVMSNYDINNHWDVPGLDGNSDLGQDFVSMKRVAPASGKNYAHGEKQGRNKGHWSASTSIYLTRRAALADRGIQLPPEDLNYSFFGSPGRANTFSAPGPILRTNVPAKNSDGKYISVMFNEVANRRDQTLEWIELKNISEGEVNLKKYQISVATAKGTDTVLYNFPDNDNIKLAAGEVLLLLDTDPRDSDAHPIAVAFNRDGGNDQGLGIGADAIKYKVANFAEGGLPDDGKFALILRNRNDRLKSHEGIVDAIGYSDNLADPAIHTKLWPLRVINDPDNRNSIAVETVHYRQHKIASDANTHGDDKDEHQALRDAGYTGIGYKRHAQRIAPHGGTPGYEEIRKNLVADIAATGVLTISEIMYDQGDGRFPQWIEIYNSSATQAVNLHSEAGWRLIIENFDDGEIPIETLSGTLNFKNSEVQTVLPQQTVMVASTRARNSGSALFDTRVIFPATRVFSAWDDQRGELTRQPDKGGRQTDPILSEQGFYIELIDGKGNLSDGVGNLVKSPNRRVAATIEWELSAVTGEMMEDGRSSILRRYRDKDKKRYSDAEIEAMGVEAAGWIAAHETDFSDVRPTWYGDQDDVGSPGITGGRVLPVSLSKFRPERLERGAVVIRWITESELNNAGFNILRSEKRDGEFKQLNTKLIAGHGTTSERNTYTHTDTSAKPNVVYYYQIQDVSLDGKVQTLRMSRLKGHISPAGKATTTWGELKALQ